MLPQQELSERTLPAPYLSPDGKPVEDLVDYELGGVALNDPSLGLRYQIWTCVYEAGTVRVFAPSVLPITLFSQLDIVKLVFTFDQNMRPFVAYTKLNGSIWYYWFDTSVDHQVTTQLVGADSVAVTLDDKRNQERGTSDILLVYTKGNNLYFRAQRDRYIIEYVLASTINATIVKLGMTTQNRVQFRMLPN